MDNIFNIIEKIQKLIKRNNNASNRLKLINANERKDIKEEISPIIYNINNIVHGRIIKERIADLISHNEKYFISEITRTTIDSILYDDYYDMQRLKTLGYTHRISVEVFEKYGIFLYATDLSSYVYAPKVVRYELHTLIEKYGLEKVTEEIAMYLKEKYSDEFGIKIIRIK